MGLEICNTTWYNARMTKRDTTFVSLRLDSELVAKIDQLAAMEGLTRTAVIERLAWREFRSARLVAPERRGQAVNGVKHGGNGAADMTRHSQ